MTQEELSSEDRDKIDSGFDGQLNSSPKLRSTSSKIEMRRQEAQMEIQEADNSSNKGNTIQRGDKFFNSNEETNRLQEKKNSSPVSRASSVASFEATTEVFLRPPSQQGAKLLSAVVSPARSQLDPRKVNSTGDLRRIDIKRMPHSFKKKNENMVLQLVLPSIQTNSSDNNNNNYLTDKSIDDILDRRSRPASFNSPRDYRPNGSYMNHAFSSYDISEYGHPNGSPGACSIIHTPVLPSDHGKGTSPEQKRQAFINTLAVNLSITYGLLIVISGAAIVVADVIAGNHVLAEVFSLIVVSMAFIYILFLTIDISMYMRRKREHEKLLERNVPEEIEMKETANGSFQFNITLPQAVRIKKSLDHRYCFNKDRHSANFYLKLGAAAFCFGHLIHSCLLLFYQIVFLTSDTFYECASVVQLVVDVCYPLYSFLLLFFIFKFSNVIINRGIILARFGIMHCLSSSLCFWVWTIYREILEALANKDDYDEYTSSSTNMRSSQLRSSIYYNKSKGDDSQADIEQISPTRFTLVCQIEGESTLSEIYNNYSPYLYPFSVEFSILVVGVLYLVWQNIGMCTASDEQEEEEASTRECRSPSGNADNTESNVAVHVDCQSSNKGLFGGFGVLVFTIVSTILFFIAIYSDGGSRGEVGLTVNVVTSLIILCCMTIACVFGYRQITKLDLNTAHHNLLDDILLFICIPAYLLNTIFSIVPAVIYSNVLGSINVLLEMLQVLIQTCFVIDGMRRSSNTKELKKKKPGREMVTFLVICNVALWIMQTFEVKSHGMQDNRYDFYGKEMWTILGHMCLPLMMFYRFHASVCFGDIWKYAYEPSGH